MRSTRARPGHPAGALPELYSKPLTISRPETFAAALRTLPGNGTRLSPISHGRINLLGHYSFAVPAAAAGGELRPLRTASEP